MIDKIFKITLLIICTGQLAMAQGDDAHWATAAKNGFGTSNTLASKVCLRWLMA